MSEQNSYLAEIHYFRIPVIDLEASVHWYSDILRLALLRKTDERAVFALGEGPLLVIVRADADSRGHFLKEGKPEFSVGFTSPNIHDFRKYLNDQDVQMDEMHEEEGHYYFHFYDPSGNKLQAHW